MTPLTEEFKGPGINDSLNESAHLLATVIYDRLFVPQNMNISEFLKARAVEKNSALSVEIFCVFSVARSN